MLNFPRTSSDWVSLHLIPIHTPHKPPFSTESNASVSFYVCLLWNLFLISTTRPAPSSASFDFPFFFSPGCKKMPWKGKTFKQDAAFPGVRQGMRGNGENVPPKSCWNCLKIARQCKYVPAKKKKGGKGVLTGMLTQSPPGYTAPKVDSSGSNK